MGINIPDSDLDIICYAKDFDEFHTRVLNLYGEFKNFESYTSTVRGQLSYVARFFDGFYDYEIFAQDTPIGDQYAVLHFKIEKWLLDFGGPEAKSTIQKLKMDGVKTEPAFCQYFGISGDPYDELAHLAQLSDEALRMRFESGIMPQR